MSDNPNITKHEKKFFKKLRKLFMKDWRMSEPEGMIYDVIELKLAKKGNATKKDLNDAMSRALSVYTYVTEREEQKYKAKEEEITGQLAQVTDQLEKLEEAEASLEDASEELVENLSQQEELAEQRGGLMEDYVKFLKEQAGKKGRETKDKKELIVEIPKVKKLIEKYDAKQRRS